MTAAIYPIVRNLSLKTSAVICAYPSGLSSSTSMSRQYHVKHVKVQAGNFFTSIFCTSKHLDYQSRRYASSSVMETQQASIDFDEEELISRFFKAAKDNDVAGAEDIIESGAFRELKEGINLTDTLGNSPLMICAQRNWSDSMILLLTNDHCDVNHQNMFGSSALMCCSSHGHLDALKVLLSSSKVEINLVSRFGQTALMKAAQAGRLASIQILLDKGANVSILNKQGKGALQIAQEKEHRQVVEFLCNQLGSHEGDTV